MTISRAALFFHLLFASLAVACTGAPCPRSSDASPWVSVRYRTTGTVGLGQEVRYFEDGRIRLYGANLESYCSRVSPATSAELADVLSSEDLPTELDSLGSRLRYRDCFLAEEVTITLDGRSATARVDALEGELLSLVGRLEDASRERFGAKHQFDVVAQATERACLSAEATEGVRDRVEIGDIRASLFYEHTGRFSEDLTRHPMTLWNVVIGGGDVEEPARDLLVVVTLEGPAGDFLDDARVRLVATARGVEAPLVDETRHRSVFGPEGELSVSFLLKDVTCYALELEATLPGTSEAHAETIEFWCGE